jgi:DNA-binding NarL/FixJ family response regulator
MSLPATSVRIAILDDHTLFRQGLRGLLLTMPFVQAVIDAATLAELLPAFSQQLPEVLLLDLEMPGANGMDVIRDVLATYPSLRVIVVSMHTSPQFIAHLVKLGARSYLPKDVGAEQLREALEAVMTYGYHFPSPVAAALAQGLKTHPRTNPSFQPVLSPLTAREREVLTLICAGRTTAEIADMLSLSTRTVDGHRKNLLEKTNTPNSVSLAMFAVNHRLLEEA